MELIKQLTVLANKGDIMRFYQQQTGGSPPSLEKGKDTKTEAESTQCNTCSILSSLMLFTDLPHQFPVRSSFGWCSPCDINAMSFQSQQRH